MSSTGKSDDDFESALLRSASCDAPDADASERAWMRFATMTAMITGAGMAHRAPSIGPRTTARVDRLVRAMTAAKWVVIGAIGGGAATLVLVSRRAPAQRPTPYALMAHTVDVGAPAPVVTPPTVQAEPAVAVISVHAGTDLVTALLPSHLPARASAVGSTPPAEPSSLAAEVAALDAARRSLDTGAPDETLTILARYLQEFPKGKLVPEAEVMAIEVRAAKGDRARVVREATRFLQRHPTAPQRTRVEQLRTEAAHE
jgi:hypothetical protein